MLIHENDKNAKEYAEIYQVAHMYYDLNMLQAEIAEQLYLSRPKVSRLLTQARELGIVEIKVNPIINRLPSIEVEMKKQFGLKDAIVVTSHPDQLELMEGMLTELAAHYISSLLQNGGSLGIVNSESINHVLNKMTFSDEKKTEIIQLLGATSQSFSAQDTTLILNKIAKQHAGHVSVYPLYTPLYVNDLYLKELLMQDPQVHQAMIKMNQCSVVLTGISPLERDIRRHISWGGQMGPHHIDELVERKAVGCICAQYYDSHGIKVSAEWNAKTIAMNLNDFVRVPTRIGIAQGLDKLKAIRGALRGQLINVLITDSNTATDLLQARKKAGKAPSPTTQG